MKINQVSQTRLDTFKDLIVQADYYRLSILLENNTDSILHFWMNTCSWNNNFVSNDSDIWIIGPGDCTRNFPKMFELDRGRKMIFQGLIALRDSSEVTKAIKIGFIYLRPSEKDHLNILALPQLGNTSYLNKTIGNENLIWSNSFKIK